jgi:hypothetical protein
MNSHRLYIDLPEGYDMSKIKLGETVTVVAKGKIKAARAEDETEDWSKEGKGGKRPMKTIPPEITLELSDVTIKGKNIFEELAEDDD